jgi:[ribosomal protein S5]-alanine N-acetyltransferase
MNREASYFLRTERLGFGRWTLDDLPLATALWGNPEVTRLIGGPFSEQQVKQRLGREIESMERFGVQYWPMFWLQNGEFVGCGGLRPYKPADRIFELGFHLLPSHWGKGLAVQAGRAVIKYAFTELGATALFAGHHPSNAASQRVLEKLGFHFTHEELYPPTGLMHPSYLLIPGRDLAGR